MAPLVSRLEKNFCRLLNKCESLVTERQASEWRFEQYVKDVDDKLQDLKKINTCQPSKDTLAQYSKRVEFLKGVIEAEKLPTMCEKALANQLLPSTSPSGLTNKMYQQTKAHYSQQMRQELLGTNDELNTSNSGVRLRQGRDSVHQNDFDAVLKFHNSMQEKVAQEMVSLVSSLKQNSILAGHIIRKDNETLDRAGSMADDRHGELKVQSDRLEVYAKTSCNWCVWIMLALVFIVFLWMLVFIRLFPKR